MKLRKALRHLVEHVVELGLPLGLKVLFHKKGRAGKEVVLRHGSLAAPLTVRTGTSDLATFDEVVLHRGYDLRPLRSPATIVDAGANIGITSLWFARKFPQASIWAIEPDKDTHRLLLKNTAGINSIRVINAALSAADGEVAMEREGLLPSSFHIRSAHSGEETVRSISMHTLMKEMAIDRIGLLKIDIEGAEKELFQAEDLSWLEKVDAIAIELHDRMEPGCGHAFFKAMVANKWNYDVHGELIVATRPDPQGGS